MSEEDKDEGSRESEADFLSYLWRHKWLAVFLFLVPVILAAVITLLLPTTYSTGALYRINKLPEIDEKSIEYLGREETRVLLDSNELLDDAIEKLEPETRKEFDNKSDQEVVHWIKEHLEPEVSEGNDVVSVRLNGAIKPGGLKAVLERILGSLKTRAIKLFRERRDRKLDVLRVHIETLKKDLATLDGKISAIREIGREQPALQAGEQNGALRGLLLRNEFESIRGQINELKKEKSSLEVTKKSINTVVPGDFQPVRVISEPYKPEVPTGPDWKLNLALGILAGLFLAVFGISFMRYVGIKN